MPGCKPGGKAVIFKSIHEHGRVNIGIVLKTVRIAVGMVGQRPGSGPAWVFDEADRELETLYHHIDHYHKLSGSSTGEYMDKYKIFATISDDILIPLEDPDEGLERDESTELTKDLATTE